MGPLSFGAKMASIGAIFMLPIALLIVLLYMQINADVAFYEQERLGVAYTRALRPLFADLETYRLADGRRAASSGRLRAAIDADFAAALASDAGPGHELGLTASLRDLRHRWYAGDDAGTLLDDFLALLGSISDNSKITLDPILDGYYVGDTLVNKVPSLIDSAAHATVVGRRWYADGRLSTDERITMTILAGQVDIAQAGIEHNLPIAIDAAPYLRATLDEPRGHARDADVAFASWLKTNLAKPSLPRGTPAELANRQRAAVAAGFALYDATLAGMDAVLRKRIDALSIHEVAVFASVAAALAVAAAMMLVTTRSMARNLADKIALEHEIVERTEVEKRLAFAASHDVLTGLANRALLMERLTQIVSNNRVPKRGWAILFLDLDRFKIVNDSLGHDIGDCVLVEAARRFERCVRSCDTLVRIGGDEFVILIGDIENENTACEVARRVLRTFDAPFRVAGRDVYAGASIGIATSATGGDRPDDVLRNADMAMYRAKALGKNRYEIFTSDLLLGAVSRLEVETDLAHALERGEFRLFYQPIHSLKDGRLTGFEALVRWQHPQRGLVYPDQFISIAEENGTIVALGEWVLRQACRQLQAWRATDADARALRMNVNVSAKQLTDPGFIRTLESALSSCGLDADGLNMEITESVLMQDAVRSQSTLARIKAMGVHIHLDDFGTGYSSLAYLRDFPIDALKIDRSFVSHPDVEKAGPALASVEIVRTIVALAQSLSLSVTAEGVESDEQREQLRALGCTHGQGYFFSRPVDAASAAAFLNDASCGPLELAFTLARASPNMPA